MVLSRQQQIEQNERRLKEIATELEAIAATQSSSTDPTEQRDLLDQLATLESEQKALQNSCMVLEKELEQAAREKVETDKRIWFRDERPLAEKERDTAVAKVMTKIRNLKKEYDKLVEVEKRWAQKWNERGRPQYLNQDRPFVTAARRGIYSFLGLDPRPRTSRTRHQKEVAEILGPVALIAATLTSEKRRAARRAEELQQEEGRQKELIAGAEELRSEASPLQGEQVESTEKTVGDAVE